ncbi:MAG: phosphoribosylaminoimidazolesuccinocarboxamide synthase [Myxococcota bacterium]
MNKTLLTTDLDLPVVHRGKVRDIYALDDKLLMITTDRLSAFDVVFNEGISGKGRILNAVSLFWAQQLPACQPFHLITDDVREMGPLVAKHADKLAGHALLVEKLDMLPVECVVRGHLVGSGWKDYQRTGEVCGHHLPKGMQQGQAFDQPIFTPATKAAVGDHDENISYDEMVKLVGASAAKELRQRSMEIFTAGTAFAQQRGLILVDTKFEFGRRQDGTLVLADEVLTPDSSRYWDAAQTRATPVGETPPSFDKQIVRDYLETLDWNKAPPPPALPADILESAAARYAELLARLTQS